MIAYSVLCTNNVSDYQYGLVFNMAKGHTFKCVRLVHVTRTPLSFLMKGVLILHNVWLCCIYVFTNLTLNDGNTKDLTHERTNGRTIKKVKATHPRHNEI